MSINEEDASVASDGMDIDDIIETMSLDSDFLEEGEEEEEEEEEEIIPNNEMNTSSDSDSSSDSQSSNSEFMIESNDSSTDTDNTQSEEIQQPSEPQETPINLKIIKDDCQVTDDESFSCPICLDGVTNTGVHRPACLKCGHIFGESCLHRWIKVGCNNDARRCPSCNTKASLKDIRILYAKKLVAIDTTELTALQVKLDAEKREKNIMKAEVDKFKVKNEFLKTEIQRLQFLVDNRNGTLPSTSVRGPTQERQCVKKINMCKNLGCRVMAFNRSNMLLVVSQHSETPLFSSHVIRKLNASILEPSKESIHVHKKQIRDMVFHPIDQHMLATVSLDKSIKLTDLNSNTVVSSVEVEEALWSCCWAGDNSNMLIVGGQMGSIFFIDRRFMKLFNTELNRKPACVSLCPIPPSSSRSFINGGFLKTRMDLLSVFERDSGQDVSYYKETELSSMKGLWSCASYDSQTNLILASAKPSGINNNIRHILSKVSNFNSEGPVIQPVVTFYGGDKASQLFRSRIMAPNELDDDTLVTSYDERSNKIKIFSINSGINVHNFSVKDKVLDLCSLTGVLTNGRRTLAGLTGNEVSIYSV